ncbi:MAG: hypothetical protein KAZ88_03350 [Acidimicrobiia bacterium]|nr:hypothetical protein [Acidimicrobiia bacterium]MBP8180011.1 hypothetical protein [Acidimicrobiia bacterium]
MKPVQLVSGADDSLRGDKRRELIKSALGQDDPSLALTEFTIPQSDSGEQSKAQVLSAAIDAASHPPFGTDHRVVTLAGLEHVRAADVGPLVAYLANPMPTTILILDFGSGRKPPALAKALKGPDVESQETEKDGGAQLNALARKAGITLDVRATRAITERLGDNLGAISGLVALLASTYGSGSRLTEPDVTGFLVESGSVPPYLLSNAIEAGDLGEALKLMDRLMNAGGMHPLPLVALLHNHYRQALLVDDPAVRTESDAVAALGGKVKPFPAKKAQSRARALRTAGLKTVFLWLNDADQALRGASGAPADIVMAQLVTRLARYHRDLNRPGGSRMQR